MSGPVRVFISYTHETDSHRRRVRGLGDRLKSDGLDVRADYFVAGTPGGGWPAWMEEEIESADFIVLICTPTYNERYRQEGAHLEGLGSRWESSLIRDLLYATPPNQLTKFVPVLPRTSSTDDIPAPLRFRVSRYRLSDYESLLRHLTAERFGEENSPNSYVSSSTPESPRFSSSIQQQYARIDQRVEELTLEQFEVISQLHGRPRALISGTPGSGKTLVAVEKALRLSDAGVNTLWLCHNPRLAAWVSRLTEASAVEVKAFEDLVGELAPVEVAPESGWSNYSQPTSEQLDHALDTLLEDSPRYQAVIVDEAQDFADEWWQIVEACLPGGPEGVLYMFFDAQQSLLPGRMNLPPAGWPLTLSRNCRNAGRIYDVMRRLSPGCPLPDEQLQDLGYVEFFRDAKLKRALLSALRWFNSLGVLDSSVAVLGGGVDFQDSILARGPFPYGDSVGWQELVRKEIRKLAQFWSPRLREKGMEPRDVWELRGLSNATQPTRMDIEMVTSTASRIASTLPAKSGEFRRPELHWGALPVFGTGRTNWRLRAQRGKPTHIEVLNAFRCDEWTWSLPNPPAAQFDPERRGGGDSIPVYTLGEIKGLERKAVLLVMQGDAPQFLNHLFVGVSRARAALAVVGDQRAYAALPSQLRINQATEEGDPEGGPSRTRLEWPEWMRRAADPDR
jgi:hypothetical protein